MLASKLCEHPGPGDGDWLFVSLAQRFLLLLPFDATTDIDGLRRLWLSLLLPYFLDPLPRHLVKG
jgi:hypothetical protein